MLNVWDVVSRSPLHEQDDDQEKLICAQIIILQQAVKKYSEEHKERESILTVSVVEAVGEI